MPKTSTLVFILGSLALMSACSTTNTPFLPASLKPAQSGSTATTLAAQCYNEARVMHRSGTFTRQRAADSPDMRRHTKKLRNFCQAYEGHGDMAFWDKLGPNTSKLEVIGAFERACKQEAASGRTVIFRPSSDHIDRMSTICSAMAADFTSR